VLTGDDGDSRVLDHFSLDRQARGRTPLPHVLRRLAVGVGGSVPVEVDVVHFGKGEPGAVKHLRDVPVEQTLDVDSAGGDTQKVDRRRNIDFRIELSEGNAQLRQRLHRPPRVIGRHGLQFRADVIVGEFA
jgi:hypothetical protein